MGDNRTELYEQIARVGKALGNGSRLGLVELLAQGPRGVVDLAETAGLNLTTVSAHLQTLKRAGLVRATRSGTTIRYELADDDVAALFGLLRDVAARHLPDVDAAARRYLGPEDTEGVGWADVEGRDPDAVVVLDVRPATEYAAGHIPGAVSIPLDELAGRLGELPTDPATEIVVYCRGQYCLFAHDAVRLLVDAGRHAVRLDDGIVEWRQAHRALDGGAPVTGAR